MLKIVAMIQCPETLVKTLDIVHETERNWQQSVQSFVRRVRLHYCYYDDVTVPFLSALQTVQYGLPELIYWKLRSWNPYSIRILGIQDFLLTYPIKTIRPLPTATLVKNLDAIEFCNTGDMSKSQVLKAQETYISSILSRINLYTSLRKGQSNFEQISRITFLFGRLLEMESLPHDTSTELISLKSSESCEDLNEKRFRDIFPDHEAEYSSSDVHNLDEFSEYSIQRIPLNEISLSDSKASFLCGLYQRIFEPCLENLHDDARTQDFMLAYMAAGLLKTWTSSLDRMTPERNRLGAHMQSFMLNLNPQIDCLSILSYRSSMATASSFDFHHDPCPWETIRVKGPLQCIRNRLLQLLNTFILSPQTVFLLAFTTQSKKMQQYDLKRTSLGKMLTGLEVLLMRAQDLEQHASIHVSIGQSLLDISGIVSKWRKLELLSWPQLLDSLEKRHARNAQKYWGKLYHLIITKVEGEHPDMIGTQHNRKIRPIPEWMKDQPAVATNSANVELFYHHFTELIKAADTFILTSTEGQFYERLRILEAFAKHQIFDYASNPKPRESIRSIGLMLEALSNYYRQFIKTVNELKVRLKIPIEKKLTDEAKLAKWDE